MNKDIIKKKANELAKKHDTRDPHKIITELGIELKYADNINSSFIRYKNGKEMILLNNQTPEELVPFVLAHELGHKVLHDEELVYFSPFHINKSSIEKEANYFAMALLNKDFEPLDGYTIENYASLLNLPKEAIEELVGVYHKVG